MKNARHNKNEKREIVQKLVSEGKTTREIATITGYTIATIRYYRESSKDGSREHIKQKVAAQRRKMKRKLIDYSGGACLKCNYDVTDAALTFHHIDPSTKSFGLGSGKIKSFERNKKECDKCCLLCHNCHAELHAGLWVLTDEMIQHQQEIRKNHVNRPLTDYDDPGCQFDESIL